MSGNAPERIHIRPTHPHKDDLDWYVWSDGTPYILATPEALAASPEVQALIAAEREACARVADPPLMHRAGKVGLWRARRAAIAAAIRARGGE